MEFVKRNAKTIKRGLLLGTFLLWGAALGSIFQAGGAFRNQAPKCIFATMIIFGIMTVAYQAVEKVERGEKSEE